MRYLGIDYGAKRVGLALSDPAGTIAFPYGILIQDGKKDCTQEIQKIIKKEKVGTIVVGLPVPFGGGESAQTTVVLDFIDILKEGIAIPIHCENEMLTSKVATRNSVENHNDASAAALILQSYLDKIKKTI